MKTFTLLPNMSLVKDTWEKINTLRNPMRRNILEYIAIIGTVNVTDLSIHFRMAHSQMSASVSKMKNLGFLEAERQGKEIYYSINEEGIDQIALLMNKINQIK